MIKRFPFDSFELKWNGNAQEKNTQCQGKFLKANIGGIGNSSSGGGRATTKTHQPSMLAFFKKDRTK